jgi:hypothetical protein
MKESKFSNVVMKGSQVAGSCGLFGNGEPFMWIIEHHCSACDYVSTLPPCRFALLIPCSQKSVFYSFCHYFTDICMSSAVAFQILVHLFLTGKHYPEGGR